MTALVLSIFPGIGLLDRGFEDEDVFLAWAAGLIDGEGCVSIASGINKRSGGRYYRADLIVSNTNRALLEPLLAMFGGRIDNLNRNGGKRRHAFQWKVTGSAHAAEVLSKVRPWLIAKARQADLAVQAATLLVQKGRSKGPDRSALEGMKLRMHVLNKRGITECLF